MYAHRKRKKLLLQFAHNNLLQKLMNPISRKKRFLKSLLILWALTFFIIALAKPQWVMYYEEIRDRGVDIMIILDTSDSMLAEDVSPNRITWAKRKIEDLLMLLQGDRIGLIAFSGGSFVLSPLTSDYETFRMLLDSVDTDVIPIEGTQINEALEEGIHAFDNKKGNNKAILLITDGEDYSKSLDDAIARAQKEKIAIHGIGIGKEEGSPIPVPDEGLKKDMEGKLVISKLHESTIKKIAHETGGIYVTSGAGDIDIQKIYNKALKKMDAIDFGTTKKKALHYRFTFFIFLGLISLILEFFISDKRRMRKMNTILFLLCLGMFVSPINTWASLKNKLDEGNEFYHHQKYKEALEKYLNAQIDYPKSEALKNNIGNTYYRLGNYENALGAYSELLGSSDKKIRQKAYYNAGNSLFKSQRYNEALDYYTKALELAPKDEDTKYNAELTKQIIEEMKKRQENKDEKNQDDSKKDEQNKENQDTKKEDMKDEAQKENQQEKNKKSEGDRSKEAKREEGSDSTSNGKKEEGEALQQGKEAEKIPKEQAEMILNNIKEERKKLQKLWIEKKFGDKQKTQDGNDW